MCYNIFRIKFIVAIFLLGVEIIHGAKVRKGTKRWKNASSSSVSTAHSTDVSVKVIRHMFQLVDDLETKEPQLDPYRRVMREQEDDRKTPITKNWYFFYPFDMSNRETKQVVVRIMQQMMYKSRVRLDELDDITKQYSDHNSFRMGLLFAKMNQLKSDILSIYSMMRNNEDLRFTDTLTLYQHLLRKYFNAVYMIEFLLALHIKYVRDARELYSAYTKAHVELQERVKPPVTYSPEYYNEYYRKTKEEEEERKRELKAIEKIRKQEEDKYTTTQPPPGDEYYGPEGPAPSENPPETPSNNDTPPTQPTPEKELGDPTEPPPTTAPTTEKMDEMPTKKEIEPEKVRDENELPSKTEAPSKEDESPDTPPVRTRETEKPTTKAPTTKERPRETEPLPENPVEPEDPGPVTAREEPTTPFVPPERNKKNEPPEPEHGPPAEEPPDEPPPKETPPRPRPGSDEEPTTPLPDDKHAYY